MILLKKTCERCHVTQKVPHKRRRCHERSFGSLSYWCYGKLTTVRTPRTKRVVDVEVQRTKLSDKLIIMQQELQSAVAAREQARRSYQLWRRQTKQKGREVTKLTRALAKLPPVESPPKRAIKVTGSV